MRERIHSYTVKGRNTQDGKWEELEDITGTISCHYWYDVEGRFGAIKKYICDALKLYSTFQEETDSSLRVRAMDRADYYYNLDFKKYCDVSIHEWVAEHEGDWNYVGEIWRNGYWCG